MALLRSMVPSARMRSDVLPWTVRVYESARVSPTWIGLGITVAWLVLYLGVAWTTGWIEAGRIGGEPFLRSRDLWFNVLGGALIGYLATASVYGVHGAANTLAALRPVLDLSLSEQENEHAGLARFERVHMLGVTGAVLALAGLVLTTSEPAVCDRVDLMIRWWDVLLTWCLVWIFARTALMDLTMSRRLSALAARHARVDLLDLGPLKALGRRGLSSVLRWSIAAALISLFFLADPFPDRLKPVIALLLIGVVATMASAPLLPLHRRLLEERRLELARVRAAIHGRLAQAAPADPLAHLGLSDLIAYEGRAAGASTWPFDLSTLLRSTLYVALGTGSWLGAALVERLLEALLAPG